MRKEIISRDQPTMKSPSGIAAAIDNLRTAQEQIAAFARERASQQLSTGPLAAISRELTGIVRRMSAYVQD